MKKALVLLSGIGALVGLAAAGVGKRRSKMEPVAADLRSPALFAPMAVKGERSLALMRRMMALQVPKVPEGVVVRTETVPAEGDRPEVRVLVYQPAEHIAPSGGLLWIHGGGLVMGTPEVGNDYCGRFAQELGIVVVSVDYRLAPEHPFPAGLDDCSAALEWMHAHAEQLGVDPARIAVGGDSAGGGLAACVAQVAHDTGGPALCHQLLVYPMLDDRTALRTETGADFVWTADSNRYSWGAYLGHEVTADEARPYASAARRTDLGGLPPAWIGVGSIDLFHDEDLDYARRLQAAGVACELHVVDGMYHAAEHLAPKATSMQDFRRRSVEALRAALA